MTEAKIWVAYNSDGDVVASMEDHDAALQELMDNFGACNGVRTVEMTLKLPEIKPLKVEGTIPDTDGPVTLTVT